MTMTDADARSTTQQCDYCGSTMNTEAPEAVLAHVRGSITKYWFCCPECLEWAEQDARDIEETNASLSAERLNRL